MLLEGVLSSCTYACQNHSPLTINKPHSIALGAFSPLGPFSSTHPLPAPRTEHLGVGSAFHGDSLFSLYAPLHIHCMLWKACSCGNSAHEGGDLQQARPELLKSDPPPGRLQVAGPCLAGARTRMTFRCHSLHTSRTAHHDFIYELLISECCSAADGLRDNSLDVLHCLVAGCVVLKLQALLVHACHPYRQILRVPAACKQHHIQQSLR